MNCQYFLACIYFDIVNVFLMCNTSVMCNPYVHFSYTYESLMCNPYLEVCMKVQMMKYIIRTIFYKWINRSSSPVHYIKNSLQNGIKTSPSNLITGGYEKLTLGLPDTNTYPCHIIGCTLKSPLVYPKFCTFFVLKICLFSFPTIKIFPSYSNFTNYNHQKYRETAPCAEESRYALASKVSRETRDFPVC